MHRAPFAGGFGGAGRWSGPAFLGLFLAGCVASPAEPPAADPSAGAAGARAGTAGSGGSAMAGSGAGGTPSVPPPGPGPGGIAEQMEPSFDPPGGLAVTDVPQFVVLGFDDNRYVDGMTWVLDTIGSRRNPAGKGNPRTHDGRPMKVSFYYTTDALDTGREALLATWRRATQAGHEVANHTHTHRALENQGVPWDWQKEIQQSNQILSEKLGVPEDQIRGFRAPFLNFDEAMFRTLGQTRGMIYDCSLTHIPLGGEGEMWQFYRHLWPYTLHDDTDGMSGQWRVGKHPRIWELPVYTLPTVGPGRAQAVVAPMAGFDSTAFGTLGKSGPDFYNSMKWALDLRLEPGDNRAPLTVGLHSDTYSAVHKGYGAPLEARRKALVDFIDYALTRPEVRFVTAVELLEWMSSPAPL